MRNEYYDEWEQRQALSTIETNPLLTKHRLKKYIEEYPGDYMSYIYIWGEF